MPNQRDVNILVSLQKCSLTVEVMVEDLEVVVAAAPRAVTVVHCEDEGIG